MVDKNSRFWEVDFSRGIAVILMIIFHVLYDLNYFDIYKVYFDSIFFQIYEFVAASIFILLVGISLSLSYSKVEKKLSKKDLQKKFLFRGLKIFSYGLFITLISWLMLPEGFIVFGILHFIGISIILTYPLLKFKNKVLPLGLVFLGIGFFLKTLTFSFYWLLWLGFIPMNFFSVDYFPLLPWFGIVLIGLFVGNILYKENKRTFNFKEKIDNIFLKFICYLGRHSLFIYFIHQPIVLSLIFIFYRVG